MKTPQKFTRFGKADIHIHSSYSDGRPSIEKILDYVEHKTTLNVIAITDHDTIEGALKAKRIAKKKNYRFEIIIGEEITTKLGHIVALFLNETIEPGLSVHETLQQIKKQGGIAIAAHPLYHTRFKNKKETIMDGIGFVTLVKERDLLDGVEVINATPTLSKVNRSARFLNDTLILKSETGSSDAHILHAIGKAYTVFEGQSAQDLKEALLNSQTRAMNGIWSLEAYLRYLFFFIPKGSRIAFNTLIHGRLKKRPKIINVDQ